MDAGPQPVHKPRGGTASATTHREEAEPDEAGHGLHTFPLTWERVTEGQANRDVTHALLQLRGCAELALVRRIQRRRRGL